MSNFQNQDDITNLQDQEDHHQAVETRFAQAMATRATADLTTSIQQMALQLEQLNLQNQQLHRVIEAQAEEHRMFREVVSMQLQEIVNKFPGQMSPAETFKNVTLRKQREESPLETDASPAVSAVPDLLTTLQQPSANVLQLMRQYMFKPSDMSTISPTDYIKIVESLAERNACYPEPLFVAGLDATAMVWAVDLPQEITKSWQNTKRAFLSRFPTAPQQRFNSLLQKPPRDLHEFISQYREFAAREHIDISSVQNQQLLIQAVSKINAPIASAVAAQPQYISQTAKTEDLLNIIATLASVVTPASTPTQQPQTTTPSDKRLRCRYCHTKGHTIDVCRKKLSADSEREPTAAPKGQQPSQPQQQQTSQPPATVKCFNCGGEGHTQQQCPSKKK